MARRGSWREKPPFVVSDVLDVEINLTVGEPRLLAHRVLSVAE
jgi:hypothetical protein